MNLDEHIRNKIEYVSETGALIWRDGPWRTKPGAPAESLTTNGYLRVQLRLGGRTHNLLSHRVAWLLVNGRWPSGVIDHIDRNRANNRIDNLRDCNQSINTARKVARERDLPRGVCFSTTSGKGKPYMVRFCGKSLGCFATPDEAGAVYLAAWREKTGDTSWHRYDVEGR